MRLAAEQHIHSLLLFPWLQQPATVHVTLGKRMVHQDVLFAIAVNIKQPGVFAVAGDSNVDCLPMLGKHPPCQDSCHPLANSVS